jgi:hypothetical protein
MVVALAPSKPVNFRHRLRGARARDKPIVARFGILQLVEP